MGVGACATVTDMRSLAALLGCFAFSAISAQTSPPQPRIPVPESAFVSAHQYTNAFFDFTLPLPKDGHFQPEDLSESDKALQHFLFAEKSFDKGITLLTVTATQVLGNPADEAQKASFIPNSHDTKAPEALDIGGRLFWKSDIEQKTFSGKLRRLRYATGARGFVLQFSVSSYNWRLAEELRDGIEAIKFVDPARIKEVAGTDSKPFLPLSAQMRLNIQPSLDLAQLDAGRISNTTYTNPFLGFSYHLPEGWHVAADAPESQFGSLDLHTANAKPGEAQLSQRTPLECTRVLLRAGNQPADDQARGLPSRIMLLAADPMCFVPDIKFPTTVHDQSALEFFGGALVRAFGGTPLMGRDASTIGAIDLGGHIFLEIPSITAVPVPGSTLLRKVHHSFVLTALKEYWVIWSFESDSQSDLHKLMKTSISFDGTEPATGGGAH